MGIGTKRRLKVFFKFILWIYVIASICFIGYYSYNEYIIKGEDNNKKIVKKEKKEEVKDLVEGKIYLNNSEVTRLYNYIPNTSEIYTNNEVIYSKFSIDKLKAKALEFIEKEDSKNKDDYIFSETTINGKVKDLYGNINIDNKDFDAIMKNPKIKFKSNMQRCTYKNQKYTCKIIKLNANSIEEAKYLDFATKDEEGSIHIYERYVSFKRNGENYDLYKDYLQQEKITTISVEERTKLSMYDLINKYENIPIYEHIYKKNGNKYYLYETRIKPL